MAKSKWRPLKRKQIEDNEYWYLVWQHIPEIISRDHIQSLVERTVGEVKETVKGLSVGYAWSAGKDSQALRVVMDQLKISECLIGISDLEYPSFLKWVEEHKPPELEVFNTGQDMSWLVKHPQMLFPQHSQRAARWFSIVQHQAQARFYRKHGLDMLILGRRHLDGNYTGRDGTGIYSSRGVVRYCPLKAWTHEEVLAACHYYDYPLPPIYHWPNGLVVGTGSWPARQWTGSIEQGWYEVSLINREIVTEASNHIESAGLALEEISAGTFVPLRAYEYVDEHWMLKR